MIMKKISREPKSMILSESLTQRTNVSRVSLEEVNVGAFPILHYTNQKISLMKMQELHTMEK